ncbi:hypothetical protein SAMN02745221_01524 [Thermosyntropha lipolytica DSM 11003]|uniref:Uncharacterized protein n=1 Tax=Thermosyntropha lipolytica DSM 11003 TaxID=1123382 RepID=A0A1M5PPF4_9FIRM|nr:hypothetical protein [Thermosyntropha lipolytica]SHH03581.1 hypothetical protein SAMN02745221_01524 [Thermosyntropha lipolytica DSM 11003]
MEKDKGSQEIKRFKRMVQILGEVQKKEGEWNWKEGEKKLKEAEEIFRDISASWETYREEQALRLQGLRSMVLAPEYGKRLEEELKKNQLAVAGSFPEYMVPPLKLVIDTANMEIRVMYGKKKKVLYALEPEKAAREIAQYWQKITRGRFNREEFVQALLAAYQYANREVYREKEVLWGRAVPLETIYSILTLHRGFRREYTREQFMFDIARVRESLGAGIAGYRLEFGYARHQERAMVVIDSQGREHRLKSINFYKEGEE